MRFTLSISHVRFTLPNVRDHRYRVACTLAYGGTTHTMRTDQQVFAPTDASPMATSGAAWRHDLDLDRRRSEVDITLRARLLTEARRELDTIEHSWRTEMFFDHVRVRGEKFTLSVHSDAPDYDESDVVYARRSGELRGPQVVNAPRTMVYVEIDPVIPLPARARVVRPAFVYPRRGTGTQYFRHPRIEAPSAINPSVIPAWRTGGRPPEPWLDRWAGQIHTTLRAWRGAFRERELQWSFETEGSPTIEFRDGNTGGDVEVFGRGDGEGRLVVSHRGTMLNKLRVLVREPVTIPTRLIVLRPSAPSPNRDHVVALRNVTENSFNHQLHIANRYLRQVAIQLGNAQLSREDGRCVGVTLDDLYGAASTYGEDDIITFVVVHSVTEMRNGAQTTSSLLGVAAGIPRSGAPSGQDRSAPSATPECFGSAQTASFTDRGTPSTSLVPPTGVPPDDPAEPQEIRILLQGVHNQPVVFLVLDVAGQTGMTGATIAHEVGHVLNLAHRHASGMPWLGSQNLMLSGVTEMANDLDIAQAKVMWHSPLVRS